MPKTKARLGQSEDEGATLAQELIRYISANGGKYLRDNNSLHIIIKGQRVPITNKRDNFPLASLIDQACGVSTLGREAQIAIQRLQIHAHQRAGQLQMRKFSAVSRDGKRLYIPLADGSLLLVEQTNLMLADNGENEDGMWVEHPAGDPFEWSDEEAHVGLTHFERLLVNTQACQELAMRWFVAMHEGVFPFVRDFVQARFLVVHIGDSQSGKTTGAERFTLLHGLGHVKGDYTLAAFNNIGDIGLLAMDNKEQSDLSQDYINFLLFLATAAERGRSFKDGRMRTTDLGRPVGVITTIEGIGVKTELRKRSVEVRYAGNGSLGRASIEREIVSHRNSINSALAEVLRVFLSIQSYITPNPMPDFREHFRVLCNLLRAYAKVAGKPNGWSLDIVQQSVEILTGNDIEKDILEHPLTRVLREHAPDDPDFKTIPVIYNGKAGTLHVTDCGSLLTHLQAVTVPLRISIPNTPDGLGRRIRSTQFKEFVVLDQGRSPDLEALKRTSNRRPIGFFFENDAHDTV